MMDEKSINSKYMLQALRLARKAWGQTSPNPMVGAIIVKNGTVIGKGYHKRAGGSHAEINAINSVSLNTNTTCPFRNSTIYVTLEPCSTYGRTPPCTEAIIKSKIKNVVIGSLDPNPRHAGAAIKILEQSGIEVTVGVEQKKCLELNEAFFYWITHKRPFVLLKMAMTLDGKIATENGDSQWITGPMARKRVQNLRKWADAILVGAETARIDSPSLTVRNSNNEPLKNWKQPRKLIASNSMSNDELCRIFPLGAELLRNWSKEDWENSLNKLGNDNITSILVEGGGELAAAMLNAGVINKVEFHVAPKILSGRNSRSVVGGLNPSALCEAYNLSHLKVNKLGSDISISGYIL